MSFPLVEEAMFESCSFKDVHVGYNVVAGMTSMCVEQFVIDGYLYVKACGLSRETSFCIYFLMKNLLFSILWWLLIADEGVPLLEVTE